MNRKTRTEKHLQREQQQQQYLAGQANRQTTISLQDGCHLPNISSKWRQAANHMDAWTYTWRPADRATSASTLSFPFLSVSVPWMWETPGAADPHTWDKALVSHITDHAVSVISDRTCRKILRASESGLPQIQPIWFYCSLTLGGNNQTD